MGDTNGLRRRQKCKKGEERGPEGRASDPVASKGPLYRVKW